jgi:hypothetical protein
MSSISFQEIQSSQIRERTTAVNSVGKGNDDRVEQPISSSGPGTRFIIWEIGWRLVNPGHPCAVDISFICLSKGFDFGRVIVVTGH